jgi:hypothetical protein
MLHKVSLGNLTHAWSYAVGYQLSPLHLAAAQGDESAMASILAANTIPVNELDAVGRTPLFLTVASSSLRCASMLLEYVYLVVSGWAHGEVSCCHRGTSVPCRLHVRFCLLWDPPLLLCPLVRALILMRSISTGET